MCVCVCVVCVVSEDNECELFNLIEVTNSLPSYFYCSFKRKSFDSVLSLSGSDKAPFESEQGLNARDRREEFSLRKTFRGIGSIKEYKKYFRVERGDGNLSTKDSAEGRTLDRTRHLDSIVADAESVYTAI